MGEGVELQEIPGVGEGEEVQHQGEEEEEVGVEPILQPWKEGEVEEGGLGGVPMKGEELLKKTELQAGGGGGGEGK